jgi:hypothetical protein
MLGDHLEQREPVRKDDRAAQHTRPPVHEDDTPLVEACLPKIPSTPHESLRAERLRPVAGQPRTHEKHRGFLSFEEILSVDSVRALQDLYTSHGKSFENEKQFLTQVRRDWYLERRHAKARLGKNPAVFHGLDELPTLDLSVAGGNFRIVGIAHNEKPDAAYAGRIQRAGQQPFLWMTESGLNTFLKNKFAINLGDGVFVSNRDCFELGIANSVAGLFHRAGQKVWSFMTGSPADYSVIMGRTEKYIARTHPEMTIDHPELPTYVRLELTLREGKILDHCGQRSAYMAEMLKLIEPGKDKAILVGFDHMAELSYFLKHPMKDEAINLRVQEDLERYNQKQRLQTPLTQIFKQSLSHFAGQFVGNVLGGFALTACTFTPLYGLFWALGV